MPQTFAADDAVELAVVERSGFVESRHAGAAIVLDPDGMPVATLGDTTSPILPRSSLKPVQALACLTAGAPLEGERLALATASHSGTDRHVSVVRDILDAAALGEEALGCPPAWPGDQATRDEVVRDGGGTARIRMNCSGKHAAMLLTCVVNGWPTDGYLVSRASSAGAHPRGRRATRRRALRDDGDRRMRRTGVRDEPGRPCQGDPPDRHVV